MDKDAHCTANSLAVGLCLNTKDTESRGARRMMKGITTVASIDGTEGQQRRMLFLEARICPLNSCEREPRIELR